MSTPICKVATIAEYTNTFSKIKAEIEMITA
jgi:hypothetical protein